MPEHYYQLRFLYITFSAWKAVVHIYRWAIAKFLCNNFDFSGEEKSSMVDISFKDTTLELKSLIMYIYYSPNN